MNPSMQLSVQVVSTGDAPVDLPQRRATQSLDVRELLTARIAGIDMLLVSFGELLMQLDAANVKIKKEHGGKAFARGVQIEMSCTDRKARQVIDSEFVVVNEGSKGTDLLDAFTRLRQRLAREMLVLLSGRALTQTA